jgi:beta-glucosidase
VRYAACCQDPGGRLPLSFPKTEDQTWLKSPGQYPGVTGPWAKGATGNVATYSEGLLIGTTPSSKTNTIFSRLFDLTTAWPSNKLQRCSSEGGCVLHPGYRWFDATGEAPLYEFGAGLSYAEYSWSDLSVAAGSVSCTVKNTASRTGSVVAQLYLVQLRPMICS